MRLNQEIQRSSMEGLKMSDAELMVYVHPSKCRNEFKAICRELSSLLFQYDETFDGVLLAYDFTVKSKEAKILAGLHLYFGVKVESKLLLFNPKPNSLVEGKIVKISPESIHKVFRQGAVEEIIHSLLGGLHWRQSDARQEVSQLSDVINKIKNNPHNQRIMLWACDPVDFKLSDLLVRR